MDLTLRKTLRCHLTKVVNNAKAVLDKIPFDIDEAAVMIDRIKVANEKLTELNEKVLESFSSDEDQLAAEYQKILDYDEDASCTILRLKQKMTSKPSNANTTVIVPVTTAEDNDMDGTSNQTRDIPSKRNVTVKLPKLDLIKFDGNLNDWHQFWEQFRTAVHENDKLDVCTKFNYLQTVLIGKAAVTVKGLVSSEACYNDAIKMLQNEFGNTERVIDSYVKKLMTLPPVRNKNDATALRNLYNTALSITRSLEALGVSANQYGLMIKSIILKNLPYVVRVEYNKANYENTDTVCTSSSNLSSETQSESYEKQITKILMFMKREVEALEQAQDVEPKNDTKIYVKKYPDTKQCTAAGLFTSTKELCLFCKSNAHVTANCDSKLDLTEKKDILKKFKRCFRCTKPYHSSRFCRTKHIKCEKCNGRHVTSLCDPEYYTNNKLPKQVNVTQSTNGQLTNLFTNNDISNIFLQTACAFVVNKDNFDHPVIRLVLDSGSQVTFIKESISRELDLPVTGTHRISVVSFGSKSSGPPKLCKKVSLKLMSLHNHQTVTIEAIEVPEICLDVLKMPSQSNPLTQGLQLADIQIQGKRMFPGISLLIGAENYWKIVTGEFLRLTENLTAINTKLGWTLHGVNGESDFYKVNVNLATVLKVQVADEVDVTKFWNLESLGIAKFDSEATVETEKFMKEKIKFNGERYEVALPWKDSNVYIDDNYNGALIRLKTLTRKLSKESKLIMYDKAIREYMDTNCAEIVTDCSNENQFYFMPHRAVYREDRTTTKVRVVFDASAHAPGLPSLNELLLPGENLVPNLLKVFLNFRSRSIGITADIEKAFLQIGLQENERNSHSFLWYQQPLDTSLNLPPIIKYRMTRVTFGVSCSPFLLVVTLRKHLSSQEEAYDDICKTMKNSFYVDDLVVSVDSVAEGKRLYEKSRKIMALANMNLRKWHTNSKWLRAEFGDNAKNVSDVKVLGTNWNIATDTLSVNLKGIFVGEDLSCPTKRSVLRVVSKIYDVLGILSPFVIRAKILIQKIWKKNIDWDIALPDDLRNEWNMWCKEVAFLEDFSIARCINENLIDQGKMELHVFSDASPHAYGAVAYVRIINENQIQCSLLIAKSRVTPINAKGENSLTLPKLELTAALCAARLQNYILNNVDLEFNSICLWSDSKIALAWIAGDPKRWKPYVSNRVKEIQKLSRGLWKYCPGKENVADMLTRGIKAKTLLETNEWKYGPSWLSEDEDCWPNKEETTENDILPKEAASLIVETNRTTEEINEVFDIAKFNNVEKTFRVTAYINRFIHNLKNPENHKTGELTTDEIKNAEIYWIRLTQQIQFGDEVRALRKNKPLNSKSTILTLNPFLDNDGVMRLGGRLQEADLPYETRHPAILPKRSTFTDRIIWSAHIKCHHSGVTSTLCHIRRRYWIIQSRQSIKSIIKNCVICKKLRGKPGDEVFAPLPRDRLEKTHPFNVIGIDFAGPLFIKGENKLQIKVYIMLITCAVTRAIHLELLPDISTESCKKALRRFIARRGVPQKIYSDNARTFKRTSMELVELFKILKEEEIQSLFRNERIKWKFIIERASWWGGWWERLIQIVKNCLKATLGRALVNSDELQTIIAEIEATVNSRPLTYIDEQPDNLKILTPMHFLLGRDTSGLDTNFSITDVRRIDLLRDWKSRQCMMKRFWDQWSREYLQQLRSAHYNKTSKNSTFKEGDVVLVYDQNMPRLLWKLAKVVKVFNGRDSKVRACEVELANHNRIRRPVQLLYPLELTDSTYRPVGEC